MKTSFYRAEHVAALKRKTEKWNAAFTLVCAATLAIFLFFVLRRNTLNAARMEFWATAAVTAGGWIAIAIHDCAGRFYRTLREHEERILASEEEPRELRGLVTLDKKSVRISRSIDVRGVRVQTAEGPVRLLVNETFAEELGKAAAQGELTLRSVEGYVTEVER